MLVGLALIQHPDSSANRIRARELWLRAQDQHERLAFDSARTLYRQATRADPTYLPAYLDHIELLWANDRLPELRAEFARPDRAPEPWRACVQSVAALHTADAERILSVLRALQAKFGPSTCIALGLAYALSPLITPDSLSLELIDNAKKAIAAFPEHHIAYVQAAQALQAAGSRDAAIALLRRGITASPHVFQRRRLQTTLGHHLLVAGDTLGALALVSTIDSALGGRDGPNTFSRISVPNAHDFIFGTNAEAMNRSMLRLAAQAGAARLEVHVAPTLINQLIDQGRIEEALTELRPRLRYASAHQLYYAEMRLRLLEGRALGRAGRGREAVRALHAAVAPARVVDNTYFLAEIHHQLAHAYETLGQWTAAAAASDEFIRVSQLATDVGHRVISFHDAALIRWKAGWHAASDSISRSMVHEIDRQRAYYAYAGEFYERVGDLGRAMLYFQRAGTPEGLRRSGDRKTVYAGLTRLHLALGNLDSALANARLHDSLSVPPFDEILVPRVLVRRGRSADAVAMMRSWSAMQAVRGNIRGQVASLASLAEVLLTESPEQVDGVSREVERLGRENSLGASVATALRLRGEAELRLRRPGAATTLIAARALAAVQSDPMERLLIEVALGDAHVASARPADALLAYTRAIRLVETTGRTINDDIVLARFKAARVRAFDGALQMVATSGAASKADALLEWSARKKAPLALAPDGSRQRSGALALRRRLAANAAAVDYVVADTTIWATVVTHAAATIERLPITPATVRELTRRLMRPIATTHAGRVDLSRAPFDREAARLLYEGLLRPLERWLGTADELIIIPDAPLHAVPFDALVASPSGDPSVAFVVDRWSIRYATAPAVGVRPAVVSGRERMLLVIGDAPGAAAERDLVRAQWRDRVDVLEGTAATEANVRRRGGNYGILHIASHATSDERDPLASHLTLSSDAEQDGLMHYAEIERWRSPHALVVLNACETSTGELLAGSGFMSLARAFQLGGSASIIATQWPIGQVSASLMARFYGGVRGGQSLTRALRAAKLSVKRDPATSHPFFWASHVLLQPL